ISYSKTDARYNTSGLMFKLYKDHFGTIPVQVSGNSPEPTPKWPAGGDQPMANTGSPTYPLDAVAALSSDRKFLTVAIVNPTQDLLKTELRVPGIRLGGKVDLWTMTGPGADAENVVGQKPQVQIEEACLPNVPGSISVK